MIHNPYHIPGLYSSSIILQLERANRGVLEITRDNILNECISIMNEKNKTNYNKEDAISKCRVTELVEIRHMAAYHLRNILDMQWKSIGRYLGNRDHSTAINSHRQWSDWSEQKYNKQIHKANERLLNAFGLNKN